MGARTWLLRQVARPIRHLQSKKPAIPGEYTRLALDVSQQGADVTIQCVTGNALQVVGLVARAPDGARIDVTKVQRTASEHGGSGRGRSRHGALSTWTHRASVNLADLYERLIAAEALDPGALDAVDAAGAGIKGIAVADAERANRKERTATFELVVFEDRLRVPRYATRISDPLAYASHRDAVGRDAAGRDAAGRDAAGREVALRKAATGEEGPGEEGPGEDAHGYWAPLGRFRNTRLSDFDLVVLPNGVRARLRVTTYGHLTVVFGDPIAPPIDVRTDAVNTVDGVLTVRGLLQAGSAPVEHARLVIAGRHFALSAAQPMSLTYDPHQTLRRHGRRQYDFAAKLDLADLIDPDVAVPPHAIADLWVEATEAPDGPVARRRMGRAPYEQRASLAETSAAKGDVSMRIIPYFTVKQRNISLILEQISTAAHQRIAAMHYGGPAGSVRRWAQRSSQQRANDDAGRPVWLLGERPDTAQDNGLHLFRYLRQHRRDIDAYYVITADSPDRKNLGNLDHVIDFGSAEHVDIAVRANRIVGTHHADYLYPTRSKRFTDLMKAPRVFLQHGVIGMKWMAPTYSKFSDDFVTDIFCVTSEREKAYIVNDLGYEPDEVKVTGLARFDALFADDVPPVPGQVLIMPTWRPWLANDEAFAASDFRAQWRALLEDPKLTELREQADVRVLFYLHSNMRKYEDHFQLPGVEFVFHGETDIQFLLKQSAVLVTDYSSPAFDFAFLGKPVIFFQFDRTRLLGRTGGHMELDTELPGFAATHRDQVVARLATVVQPRYTPEPEYQSAVSTFLTYHDRHNCERITRVVAQAQRTDGAIEAIRRNSTYRFVEYRARRSKFYFPVMRRVYWLLQRLPMAENTIVFESSMGKQFSDSPRAIYDELRRRGDSRRRVWIYHRTPPVDDPQLTIVKRYSPRYFYYLARAKYWVSNQNLPHYITRRPKGVYLQTWHGTPLKRMLYDLDHIVGRDEGYQGRVTTAISQWTHLLSPSPYATAAFRSAFRYTGSVLELGYPRNDVLVGDTAAAIRRETRRRLGIADHQRVVLYAPTFRDDQKKGKKFRFELPIDLQRFASEFGDGTVLLLRTHFLISNNLVIPPAAAASVRNVSDYPEVADLYLAADALITDYSSVMFDFALTGRPIVYFPYDLELYRDELRGFYLAYRDEMPGPIAETEDELFAAIRNTAHPSAELLGRVRAFAARFAPNDDGHAAARIVDAVFT